MVALIKVTIVHVQDILEQYHRPLYEIIIIVTPEILVI